ncbi:MAG: hypothetical protein ABI193_23795 [Minicystis sp.]
MREGLAISLLIVWIGASGCKKGSGEKRTSADAGATTEAPVRLSFPGTQDGAAAVVRELVKPGGYAISVFRALRPDPEDYSVVFTPDVAIGVRTELDPIFDLGNMSMKMGPELTELQIAGVRTEDLRAGTGKAETCPSAWKWASRHMRPGVVMYCFKLVKPGETEGQVRDGLIYVNGHWAIFPKPFQAIRGALKDAGVHEDDE